MAAGVEGVREVSRTLRRLVPEQEKEIDKALDRSANDIAERARAIAPRETGELAGAIEVRKSLEGFTATGAVGNFARMLSRAKGGMARFTGVFPNAKGDPGWYAAWVEFGTKDTDPKPFLLPSFHSLKKQAEGRVRRAVNKAVREAARRG